MIKKPIECDAPVHVAPKIFKATVSLGRKAWSISGTADVWYEDTWFTRFRKLCQRSDIKSALFLAKMPLKIMTEKPVDCNAVFPVTLRILRPSSRGKAWSTHETDCGT